MKNYELTVIFHPDLEMNVDPALDKVKQILEANHAKIITEESDGKHRLSYPIRKQNFGLYYYFELELPPEAPGKISSTFNISEEVIRYLLVKTDPRKLKLAARDRSRKGGQSSRTESGTHAESSKSASSESTDSTESTDTTASDTTNSSTTNQKEK